MEVRFAKKEELEQVNALRRMVNQLHVDGRPDIFRPDFGPEMQELPYRIFEKENWSIVVAVEGDCVCGMAIVQYIARPASPYMHERKIYHVEEFGVDARYRRRHVATELVAFMERDARDRGYSKIELDVWSFNEDAMAFYEAAGFRTYRRFLELEVQPQ